MSGRLPHLPARPPLSASGYGLALAFALWLAAYPALANDKPSETTPDDPTSLDDAPGTQRFAVHGQATYVEQETNAFTSPYRGANSLSPAKGAQTVDATLVLGVRPWTGAEFWVSPEIDQGFGLDNTLGVAGFPSAEAYKVGKAEPYLRLPRAFLRQTLNLDAPTEAVDSDQLQLAGLRSANRWVFTVGKYAVTDIFDTNRYAHDAKNDFLNWAAVDTGTFDYAADSWGYTVGAAAEWYQGVWTLRGGLFMMSTIPNSEHLDPGFHEFQMIAELEHRHELFAEPGRVLVTVFDSRARMGTYADALRFSAENGGTPDTANVREFRSRLGASMSLEQQVSENLGVFARLGKAAGNVETYEFTDVDRSVATGLSLQGAYWRRKEDTVGLMGIVNGISADFERYLHAGGLGPLIGDGQLPHPGAEQIIETYYRVAATGWAQVTLDYQWVKNPAYNTDRGPASIFALRVHAQF
jgi:high affinity Mn2+ porin